MYVTRADTVLPIVAKCTITAASGNLTCVDSGVATNNVSAPGPSFSTRRSPLPTLRTGTTQSSRSALSTHLEILGYVQRPSSLAPPLIRRGWPPLFAGDGMQIIAVGNNGGKLRLCTITATDDLACTINTISAARSTRSRAPQVRPGVSGRDCKEVVKSAMSMKPTS